MNGSVFLSDDIFEFCIALHDLFLNKPLNGFWCPILKGTFIKSVMNIVV